MYCILDLESGTSISALSQILSSCVASGRLLTLSVFPHFLNGDYTDLLHRRDTVFSSKLVTKMNRSNMNKEVLCLT